MSIKSGRFHSGEHPSQRSDYRYCCYYFFEDFPHRALFMATSLAVKCVAGAVLKVKGADRAVVSVPGNEIRSEICSFRTLNPAASQVSFTIWNDTHENIPTVMKLSQNLKASPTDFLFWNGDVTNDIQLECQRPPAKP